MTVTRGSFGVFGKEIKRKKEKNISHKRRAGVYRTTLEFRSGIQTKEEKNKRKNNRRTRGKRKKRVSRAVDRQRQGYNVVMGPPHPERKEKKERKRKKERETSNFD